MTKYAQIQNGIVVSHCETDRPLSDFPDVTFVPYSKELELQDGWLYDGKQFISPEVKMQEKTESDILVELKERIAKLEQVVQTTPQIDIGVLDGSK